VQRIIFMGTPDFAVPSLRGLVEQATECEVVAVVTREDKPRGRGRKLSPPPVKVYADLHAIPVFQPKGIKRPEAQEMLHAQHPDLIVVAAYGRILPPAVLDMPRFGCINVHASLLPRHRGASPIAHAILAGDRQTGVSIMRMEAGMDTGPVYMSEAIPIPGASTCGSLAETLANLGAACLLRALPGILDGSLVPVPQDDAAATYAPLLRKEDGRLSFTSDAEELSRKVRAYHPWPGAFAYKGDTRVQILVADAISRVSGGPGVVVRADTQGVVVACARGGLRVQRVKPAGRQAMDSSAWVAGRGVSVGEMFA
jgi:methionyl-tRNA formyltransferase